MSWQKILLSTIATFVLILTFSDQVSAQSLFGNTGHERRMALALSVSRVFLVLISAGIGFGIGWLLSPKSKQFRKVGLLIMAGFAAVIVIFNSGFLGWGAAWALAIIGFFTGIGYPRWRTV